VTEELFTLWFIESVYALQPFVFACFFLVRNGRLIQTFVASIALQSGAALS
jgi:hypothetical protein